MSAKLLSIKNSKIKKFNRNSKFENRNFILYLDTSDEMAEISIWQNDQKVKEIRWHAGRDLSKTLSIKYLELLKKVQRQLERDSHSESIKQFQRSNISGICVFIGPGSFTGLRIGISFANGLAFGLGIPVYETKKRGEISFKNLREIVVPFYGSPPKITKPKKR